LLQLAQLRFIPIDFQQVLAQWHCQGHHTGAVGPTIPAVPAATPRHCRAQHPGAVAMCCFCTVLTLLLSSFDTPFDANFDNFSELI
jgi:hypothetical protein